MAAEIIPVKGAAKDKQFCLLQKGKQRVETILNDAGFAIAPTSFTVQAGAHGFAAGMKDVYRMSCFPRPLDESLGQTVTVPVLPPAASQNENIPGLSAT